MNGRRLSWRRSIAYIAMWLLCSHHLFFLYLTSPMHRAQNKRNGQRKEKWWLYEYIVIIFLFKSTVRDLIGCVCVWRAVRFIWCDYWWIFVRVHEDHRAIVTWIKGKYSGQTETKNCRSDTQNHLQHRQLFLSFSLTSFQLIEKKENCDSSSAKYLLIVNSFPEIYYYYFFSLCAGLVLFLAILLVPSLTVASSTIPAIDLIYFALCLNHPVVVAARSLCLCLSTTNKMPMRPIKFCCCLLFYVILQECLVFI